MGTQSSFWSQVRKGTEALRSVFTGPPKTQQQVYPSPNAENTTARERAFILGHALTYPISDHRREVASNTNWVHIAAHAKALQLAQATVDVGRAMTDIIAKGNEAHDTTTANEEKVPHHPLMRRFAEPNPIDNQMTYLYRVGMSICLTGAAYIFEVRNQLGFPLEWWCLPRYWFQPMLAYQGMPDGGWRVTPNLYGFGQQIANRFGTTFYLHRHEVMQIGWPDPTNPAEFTSPLSACSDIIDVGEQRIETENAALLNALNPSMILSIEGQMPKAEKERMIAELKARKQGPRNAHEVLLLENIAKYDMGTKLNELEAATGKDQDRENIMGVLGVPAAAAGMGGEDGYSAISAKLNSFSESQVQPLCSLLAKTKERRYRRVYNDPRLTINISAKRFDDPTLDLQKSDKLFQAATSGGCTWNEWRASMDLPARPDCDQLVPQDNGQMPGEQPQEQMDLSVPGMEGTGDVGRPKEYDGSPDFDLSVDLPTNRLTGLKQPDMQAATGQRPPSLNGKH